MEPMTLERYFSILQNTEQHINAMSEFVTLMKTNTELSRAVVTKLVDENATLKGDIVRLIILIRHAMQTFDQSKGKTEQLETHMNNCFSNIEIAIDAMVDHCQQHDTEAATGD